MNSDTVVLAIFLLILLVNLGFIKQGFVHLIAPVVAVYVHFPGQQLHDYIIWCISA